MAVQNEATGGVGRDRCQNVRRIDECQADSVGEADRNYRILNDLMMEQDHPGTARGTPQDRLERLQLRRIDDADRIGEREMATGVRIEKDDSVAVLNVRGFNQRKDRVPDLRHLSPSTD